MKFPGVLVKEHMQYGNSRGSVNKEAEFAGVFQIDRMKNSPHACLCSACRISISLGFLFVTLLLNFKGVSSALEFLRLKMDIISCIAILKFQAPPAQKRVFQKSIQLVAIIILIRVASYIIYPQSPVCLFVFSGTAHFHLLWSSTTKLNTFLFIYLINIFIYNFTLCQTRPYFVRF